MMMAVGIDFTEYTINCLSRRGFSAGPAQEFDFHRQFVFPLESEDQNFGGFEIHVVHDEREYLDTMGRQHFYPYLRRASTLTPPVVQPNGIKTFGKILSYGGMDNSDLKRYLELRKGFDLPALLLKCDNLESFAKIATPDLSFEINHRPGALIHLGPSCFDLVVVQSG